MRERQIWEAIKKYPNAVQMGAVNKEMEDKCTVTVVPSPQAILFK
jgi:hypothetical protein